MGKASVLTIVSILALFLSPYISEASDENLSDLSITCPSQVNESYAFIVTVKANNESIANATITFNGETNLTNSSGMTIFYAPRVLPDENNNYSITASKEGYNSTTINITVINIPQLFPIVSNPNIGEETEFVITAVDDEGRLVENATITFNGEEFQTDENGTVTLIAPSTYKSKEYTINATKSDYINNYITIIISPGPSQENLLGVFIIIGICIFIIIFPITILIIRHLRRKRINRM